MSFSLDSLGKALLFHCVGQDVQGIFDNLSP